MWTFLYKMDYLKDDASNITLMRRALSGNSSDSNGSLQWEGDYIYDSDDDFEACVNLLNKFGMPVIIFGGLVGNTMSFVVFAGSHLRMQSCSVYLAFLNVVDSLFLLILLTGWLGWFRVYLFHQPIWCQTIIYGSYVMSFLSAWGVVSFTVERYIVVYHPLKRMTLCTRQKAIITVVALSVGALFFYSFTLFTNGIVDHPNYGGVCLTYNEYDALVRAMTAVDTIITLLLPSVTIVLLNIAIVVRVWSVMHKRLPTPSLEATSPLHNSDNGDTNNLELKFRIKSQASCTSLQKSSGSMSKKKHPIVALREHQHTDARRNMHLRTTRSLLVVSTVFVVLNLPSHSLRIHFVLYYLLHTDNLDTAYLQKWQQILQFLSYMNYSANFLLYCACSQSFRSGLRRLYSGMRRSFKRSRRSFLNKVTQPKTMTTR